MEESHSVYSGSSEPPCLLLQLPGALLGDIVGRLIPESYWQRFHYPSKDAAAARLACKRLARTVALSLTTLMVTPGANADSAAAGAAVFPNIRTLELLAPNWRQQPDACAWKDVVEAGSIHWPQLQCVDFRYCDMTFVFSCDSSMSKMLAHSLGGRLTSLRLGCSGDAHDSAVSAVLLAVDFPQLTSLTWGLGAASSFVFAQLGTMTNLKTLMMDGQRPALGAPLSLRPLSSLVNLTSLYMGSSDPDLGAGFDGATHVVEGLSTLAALQDVFFVVDADQGALQDVIKAMGPVLGLRSLELHALARERDVDLRSSLFTSLTQHAALSILKFKDVAVLGDANVHALATCISSKELSVACLDVSGACAGMSLPALQRLRVVNYVKRMDVLLSKLMPCSHPH